ncbi:helix-turn-helix domain-containing protein [Actinokineospora diospyrosa]|uniref:DNA binding domain-containing protein, excisionase family n=1 Tax=Actinokineospora diospyrosa TaxID=103728 RepID=A0ABT1IIS2_9PSEU|nr:helix-turn-helix domain-containing protein [Actinokineospora diospyrosa]MCP2272550.1 DNA binding domain-containing protein, excisionase family [Actinokineospora diospyrosa]
MTPPAIGTSTPTFYTVREAAAILRVDPATLYRAIREDSFPAVKVRTRYVVPSRALDALIDQAQKTGGLVDPGKMARNRRTTREIERLAPEWQR